MDSSILKSYIRKILKESISPEQSKPIVDKYNSIYSGMLKGNKKKLMKYVDPKFKRPNPDAMAMGRAINLVKKESVNEDNSYIRVSEPRFVKDKNNPNFLNVYIDYETPQGSSIALGKETMTGQIRRESAAEAMKQMNGIANELEAKHNIEDIEVVDMENGKVRLFAVSDDFNDMVFESINEYSDLDPYHGFSDKTLRGVLRHMMKISPIDLKAKEDLKKLSRDELEKKLNSLKGRDKEEVNETLKLGVKYELPTGETGFIITGGSNDPKDWMFKKQPYLSVKDKLKPASKQPGKYDGAFDMGHGKGHHIDEESVNEYTNPGYQIETKYYDPNEIKEVADRLQELTGIENIQYKEHKWADGTGSLRFKISESYRGTSKEYYIDISHTYDGKWEVEVGSSYGAGASYVSMGKDTLNIDMEGFNNMKDINRETFSEVWDKILQAAPPVFKSRRKELEDHHKSEVKSWSDFYGKRGNTSGTIDEMHDRQFPDVEQWEESKPVDEVYSEKQRKWACAQKDPKFDEMCKDTAISKKKLKEEFTSTVSKSRAKSELKQMLQGYRDDGMGKSTLKAVLAIDKDGKETKVKKLEDFSKFEKGTKFALKETTMEKDRLTELIKTALKGPIKEGYYGTSNIENITGALGYGDLNDFFNDNPGAIETLTSWIEDIPEFREKLEDEFSNQELEELGFYDLDGYDSDESKFKEAGETSGFDMRGIDEDKDWIQKAIKRPGALRKKLGVPKDKDIPKSLINKTIKKLKKKDKDDEEEGTQLGAADERELRQLNLAKTLSKFNENKLTERVFKKLRG